MCLLYPPVPPPILPQPEMVHSVPGLYGVLGWGRQAGRTFLPSWIPAPPRPVFTRSSARSLFR